MKRWLIASALIVALAIGARAQATPIITWEHDGLNITLFKCVVDKGTVNETVTVLSTLPAGNETYTAPLPACTGVMVNGTHSVVIQACNGSTCTNAVAITVVKL